jgi:hypothetical protein
MWQPLQLTLGAGGSSQAALTLNDALNNIKKRVGLIRNIVFQIFMSTLHKLRQAGVKRQPVAAYNRPIFSQRAA